MSCPRSIQIAPILLLMLLCAPLQATAEIEATLEKNLTLEAAPRDIALSRDGATAYILCEKTILVLDTRRSAITDRIALQQSFDCIALAPDEETAFLTDRESKRFATLQISRVFEIPAGASPVIGSPEAPVTVTAFLDIQCPYCARVYPVLEQLLKAYPTDVRLVVKHFPLRMHRFAEKAAMAALAAAPEGKYPEMLERLFQNYKTLNDASLLEHARALGLNVETFQGVLESPAQKKQIQDDMGLGRSVGVRGVPALFINGRRAQKRSLEALSAMVRQELGRHP